MALLYDWRFWARPNQLPPDGDWDIWLILAGRGWGKTRTGAEFVQGEVDGGRAKRIALLGRTAADVRDVIVNGESGILNIAAPWNKPKYEPTKRLLTWPNGAIATLYSADKPEQLRGPQHDLAWVDELASYRYEETWDMLLMGLRLGTHPRVIVTTTPRATKLIRQLVKDAAKAGARIVITTGSTFENSDNLADNFLRQIRDKYEGTRLGRQEIYAAVLEDVVGALWHDDMIDRGRLPRQEDGTFKVPSMSRIVVSIDPSTSNPKKESKKSETSEDDDHNEAGIVVAGLGTDNQVYILEDASIQGSPDEWAKRAVAAYHEYKADLIIAETNNGGAMVEMVIKTVDKSVNYKEVVASRGKITRAEPIAALYEQCRVHHLGVFAELEDQMCTYVPGEDSPDRMDALVWAVTELMPFSVGAITEIKTAPKANYNELGPAMSMKDYESITGRSDMGDW